MLASLEARDKTSAKRRLNRLCDILIAETAIKNGLILVSGDANLRAVTIEFGGRAIERAQLSWHHLTVALFAPLQSDSTSVVGRIFKANAPVGTPWMWTLAFGQHEDRTPTDGCAATREAAMAAFAKSWRRE
jgi:hypothetical protein